MDFWREEGNGRQSYLNHINQLFCIIYGLLFYFSITAKYTSAPDKVWNFGSNSLLITDLILLPILETKSVHSPQKFPIRNKSVKKI